MRFRQQKLLNYGQKNILLPILLNQTTTFL